MPRLSARDTLPQVLLIRSVSRIESSPGFSAPLPRKWAEEGQSLRRLTRVARTKARRRPDRTGAGQSLPVDEQRPERRFHSSQLRWFPNLANPKIPQ